MVRKDELLQHHIQTLPVLPPPLLTMDYNFLPPLGGGDDDDDDDDNYRGQPKLPPTTTATTTAVANKTYQVMEALNHAVSSPQCLHALEMALTTFSHNETELHNHEMGVGVHKALFLKLGYIVATSCEYKQIAILCQTLTKVYQCSIEYRIASFQEIGVNEIIPLLVHVWKHIVTISPFQGNDNIDNQEVNNNATTALVSLLQVFRIFSRLDEHPKSVLIRWENGAFVAGMLQMLVSYHQQWQKQVSSSSSSQQAGNAVLESSELTQEIFGFVKDLTFRSLPTDKEFLFGTHEGILHFVIELYCRHMPLVSVRLSEVLTSIIWNLALIETISIALLRGKRDDSNDNTVSTNPESLVILQGLSASLSQAVNTAATLPPSTTTLEHRYLQSKKWKRNAISALGNLLSFPENQKVALSNETSRNLHIAPTLMSLVAMDTDAVVRRRAMRTIRCLTSEGAKSVYNKDDIIQEGGGFKQPYSSQSTPTWMFVFLSIGVKPFLIKTITQAAEEDDNDRDTSIQACETVGSLITHFDATETQQLQIATCQRVEQTLDCKVTHAACRCLLLCIQQYSSLSLSTGIRNVVQLFSDLFWRRLETTTELGNENHESISKLLLLLAQQGQSQVTEGTDHPPAAAVAEAGMEQQQSSSLADNPSIVRTLNHLLSQQGPEYDDSRNDALEVVLLLVQQDHRNKKKLAENEGLLSALVYVCLMYSGPRKDAAKQLLLDLVPEL